MRITPAHAGKRMYEADRAYYDKNHPRTRGEKKSNMLLKLADVGSPPHTRGKASAIIHAVTPIRITPAHAGKSYH